MSSLLDDIHTSYKWIFQNFGKICSTRSNTKVKSPKFAMADIPKIEWYLVLEVCNTTSKAGEFNYSGLNVWGASSFSAKSDLIFSLYLENYKADEKPVSLNIEFSILGAENEKVFTGYSKISGVIVNSKKYGFEPFISEAVLCKNVWVNNGLKVLCEIKQIDETSSGNLSLLKGFDSFLQDGTFSDVVLLLGEKKIYAHKLILSSKSPVFHRMFLTNMKEANSNEAKINGIEFEVFNELLRFMYTGKVDKLNELGFEIYKAAHFCQIDDLRLICEHFLQNALKIENSIDILKLSDEYVAKTLKKSCVAFILKNLQTVMKTPSYTNLYETHPHLPFELLNEIGSRNSFEPICNGAVDKNRFF